ncbi:MAG: hypothetical protein ACYC3Q_01170 [Gemmatimonadaceae bacterium]
MRFAARYFAVAGLLTGMIATAGCDTGSISGAKPPTPADSTTEPRCIFNVQIAMSSKGCVPGPEFVRASYAARPGATDFGLYHDSTSFMPLTSPATLRLPMVVLLRTDGVSVVLPDEWVTWTVDDGALTLGAAIDNTPTVTVRGTGTVHASYNRFRAPPLQFRLLSQR